MSSDRIVGDLAKRSLKPAGFRTVKKLDLFTTSLRVQGLYSSERLEAAPFAFERLKTQTEFGRGSRRLVA